MNKEKQHLYKRVKKYLDDREKRASRFKRFWAWLNRWLKVE